MIPPITIYQQNYGTMWAQNIPPQYRLPKFLAWGTWIFTALQWFHDLLFSNGYSDGSNAANIAGSTTYAYGNRVVGNDYAVYELKNTAGITTASTPVQPYIDTANWFKVLDTFIGVRERSYYTGQKIYLEFILNRQYQVSPTSLPFAGASHSTQIYISPSNNPKINFWLSNGSVNSQTSYMANDSKFQRNYLGNSYSAGSSYAFTVYVPSAVYTVINANQPPGVTGYQAIAALVQKYCQANLLFNITTY